MGAPFESASPSCMITMYDFVPAGPVVHLSPGKTLAPHEVFCNGMSPSIENAGDVTTSFSDPLAGTLTIARYNAPASTAGGACCADAAATDSPSMARTPAPGMRNFMSQLHECERTSLVSKAPLEYAELAQSVPSLHSVPDFTGRNDASSIQSDNRRDG